MERRLLDYMPDMEFAVDAPSRAAPTRGADEQRDMAFGAALLEVAGGAELESWLAELVASVGGAALPATPLGRTLIGALKQAAEPVLPIRSGAGAGAELKVRAARLFGLELEGLSAEDKEFEVARHFVRFAGDAIANAAAAGGEPRTQVQAALLQSARRYAPGLLRHAADTPAPSGRWRRQGKHIVVLNC
ncbi:hypothetical protein [Janthinobacterium fluminis]|uniref:Uncharacterized protein n=1 Tax=Janthinobacterium fluminis TaxID=2987524 RepID=A0ABT5JYI3_9BURK|nr:hypothetical protein [Janthinobacterium fluminis]MDC8756597.1 hypothetical protein [Janthinobacterium fluminis]